MDPSDGSVRRPYRRASSRARRFLRAAHQRGARRRSDGDDGLEGRLVWLFGSPRSGSTWLLNLVKRHPSVVALNEPLIGVHLAPFAPNLLGLRATHLASRQMLFNTLRADTPNYFFARAYEETWRPLTRQLLLGRFGAEVAREARSRSVSDPVVLIKEPNGSQAAEVIMSVLPRSRLLFLLRDGRDVVDSELDALGHGSWLHTLGEVEIRGNDRVDLVEHLARTWLFRTEVVQRAFHRHSPENRMLITYEDLLVNTRERVADVCAWLGLHVERGFVESVIGQLSFDAIPADQRGSGRFARAARPGLWQSNLSEEEKDVMHAVMGNKLAELGYK